MPPLPPPQIQAPPDDGVMFDTFSGIKNTVAPEKLTARQLSRARNVDLDDLGQVHRRRGRTLVATGNWTALFTARAPALTFGVQDGNLVLVKPDYSTRVLGAGMAPDPVAWVQVGATLYFCSPRNSGQIDLRTLAVSPWGTSANGKEFWFSPVVNPEPGLGQVGGKLLGPPPLGNCLTWHNGRIYIGAGSVVWGTELYLYNYVDKTKGFRQFESAITGLIAVEDGVYVGTMDGLYFLSGTFNEHVRTIRERAGVVPGSMVQVPGELVDPEGRRFPDLPRPTSKAMACLTTDGVVIGLGGGVTHNLTRTEIVLPTAIRATTMFRQEDGMNTVVVAQQSGGTPTENAKFGDYLSATVIRAAPNTTLTLEELGLLPKTTPTPVASGTSSSPTSGDSPASTVLSYKVVASSSFNAVHAFAYPPEVWAVDSNNEPVEVDYTYVNATTVYFTFGQPFTGTLYLA